MRKIKYLIWIFFGLASIFLGTQKIKAADSDVVINEVMVDPGSHNNLCNNDSCEWLELYNKGDDQVDLTGWIIDEKVVVSSVIILPDDYLVITKNKTAFLNIWPIDDSKVVEIGISLTNSYDDSKTDTIIIKNSSVIEKYKESYTWDEAAGEDISWEKIDPRVSGDDNWQKSYVLGGTPGKPNSKFVLPDYPDEVLKLIDLQNAMVRSASVTSIIDGDTIKVSSSDDSLYVRLLAVDAAESGESLFEPAKDFTKILQGKNIDLIISKTEDEQFDRYGRTLAVVIFENKVFNTQLLERGLASYYDTDNLVLKNAAWQAIEEQAQDEKIGLWASAVTESVILSELFPNPIGADGAEWIEIYNPLEKPVNLSYFLLDQYLVLYGTIIPAKSWLVLLKSQTGITLNNAGDSVKLFFPDGILADETTYGNADEGLSWAWGSSWSWTTKVTPGAKNIIATPPVEEIKDEQEEENIPKNSVPIEIKTGEAPNYENYLVKITGMVVSTSGNTFYLDDGSGKVKVYIQAATGIDKPEMHTGDIFEIMGIVNLYRGIWRVLPQKQEDIKLIQAKKEETDTETTKTKTTTKSSTASTAKSSTTTANARSPTKKVASANSQITANRNPTQVEGYKSPFWLEITKALTGLAGIFLIVLLVKIWKTKRESADWRTPIGGSFGDDYT